MGGPRIGAESIRAATITTREARATVRPPPPTASPITPSLPHTPFFFQAEDGIRDDLVTGVQTCALPISYEEIKEAFSPESLLPMKLSENQVRDSIHRWYGSRWFAPNKLKHGALTDIVKGLYIPYWTFDAQVHADWTAESGYYYYETETYTDENGRTQTRQVQ